jgi:hypothetical protein
MKRLSTPALIVAGLVCIALGLAGCQRNTGAVSSAAPAASASAAQPASAATSAASAAASATVSQTGETPQQFVTRLFAPYQPGGQQWTDPDTPAAEKAQKAFEAAYDADFYDPEFLKLINDNSTIAMDKVGGVDLDYDPLCQCQDSGGRLSYVSGQPNGQFFDAKVTNDGDHTTYTLVLIDTPKGWRLYSVIDDGGDVRAWLTKHNACMRAAKNEKQADKCVDTGAQ